jgi:hypothetical protein
MKLIKLLALVLLPIFLLAETNYVAQWPDRLSVDGGVAFHVTPSQWRALGGVK